MEDMKLEFEKFIFNRQLVAFNRNQGKPWPWSDDEILNKFKFCNVFRELDSGTIYLFDKVLLDKTLTREEKALNICLYRFFNRKGFFDNELLDGPVRVSSFDQAAILKKVNDFKDSGGKVFNNAYTIFVKKTNGNKQTSILSYVSVALKNGTFAKIAEAKTMQDAFGLFNAISHCGNFMSYQMAVDMGYISDYTDSDSFVVVGPGAILGLKLIYGLDKISQNKANELCMELHAARHEWFMDAPKSWESIAPFESKYLSDPYLISPSNLQNCLCEFRKYHNIKHGLKQRKRLFRQEVKNA